MLFRSIIMSGNVRGLNVLLPLQYEYLANLDGIVTEEEQEQLDKLQTSIQQLDVLDSMDEDGIILGVYRTYWQSLMNYDPIETAKSISQPVLVLQGERDYQVTMEEYNLWKKAYGKEANWKFRSYSSLNHMMMYGTGAANPDEYMKAGEVDQQVIEDIAAFVR